MYISSGQPNHVWILENSAEGPRSFLHTSATSWFTGTFLCSLKPHSYWISENNWPNDPPSMICLWEGLTSCTFPSFQEFELFLGNNHNRVWDRGNHLYRADLEKIGIWWGPRETFFSLRPAKQMLPSCLCFPQGCSLSKVEFSKHLRKVPECPSVSSVPAFFSFPCFLLPYSRMDYPAPLLTLEVPISQEELNISFCSPPHFQNAGWMWWT